MKTKVTVVGGGNVGATVAQGIALKELADVVVIDIIEGVPQGKTLDLMETAPVEKSDSILTGANNYDLTESSDIVVITAGLPRKPGMSRDDLLWKNEEIVAGVTQEVAKRSPNAVLVVVSNPLDAMCEVARRVSGFPRQRVIGMAGVLDSVRCVPAGRIRHQRSLRRRADQAWQERHGADHRDHADRGRARRTRQVRGGGEGAVREAEDRRDGERLLRGPCARNALGIRALQ